MDARPSYPEVSEEFMPPEPAGPDVSYFLLPATEGPVVEGESPQAPTEFPEEVLTRFKPTAQRILLDLMAHAGELRQPNDLRGVFDNPDAVSVKNRISQYLREISEDPETGPWLHRWGSGGWASPRFCVWGTGAQAAAFQEQLKKDISPGIPINDPIRPKMPYSRPPKSSKAEGQPKSAFTGDMALPARRFEPAVPAKPRDSKRGEAVLRAWEMDMVYEEREVRLRIGGLALAGADTLASEIVQTVAEVDGSLSPMEVLTMLAEYWEGPLGLKTVIDRLDFLRSAMAVSNVSGWKDSGPVTESGDEQRLVRLDLPEPAPQQGS